jgi:hypothetical protein
MSGLHAQQLQLYARRDTLDDLQHAKVSEEGKPGAGLQEGIYSIAPYHPGDGCILD